MNLTFYAVLVVTGVVAWWLSSHDTGLSGADKDKTVDLTRRVIRCGITLLLMGVTTGAFLKYGLAGGWILIAIIVPLGLIWAGCLSELFAAGFYGLVDSADNRTFDPKQTVRDLDKLGELVRNGRYEEAIALCGRLEKSGEASGLAIETMLFRIYSRKFGGEHMQTSPRLVEIQRLRAQGNFGEAESRLNSLLEKEPDNLAAVLMLMRIYVQDMLRPDKANALLEKAGQQRRVPHGFIGYARHSIDVWSGIVPAKTVEGIESLLVGREHSQATKAAINLNTASIEELLANGHLATAIELLESQIKEQPLNFDLWMKLGEAHGVFCGNIIAAGKIIKKMETNFGAEQVHQAKTKLKEWQAGRRS
jgi:tetratricopeptide (TPR) repeat protein